MHPFSPPRFLHKYERQLSILIVGTLRWKIAGSKREAFRQERGFADVSHKSLTFDLKSVPPFKKEHWRKKKKNSIHYSIHSHLTRVAWFPVHQVSLFTNHRVPTLQHFTALVPKTNPYYHTLAYPSSRTPVPLSLLPRDSPTAWVRSAPLLFDRDLPILESKKSTHPVSCTRSTRAVVRKGWGGKGSFLEARKGDVDSSEKETRRKRKGARLTSVLVMAWRIGRDWIEPTRNTSGLNERGWATEMAEVGQRETASAALGVGVGWLSGARVVG